jgi:hypothetical protein
MRVTGRELRTLADAAWEADQRDIAEALHDLARKVEADEQLAETA